MNWFMQRMQLRARAVEFRALVRGASDEESDRRARSKPAIADRLSDDDGRGQGAKFGRPIDRFKTGRAMCRARRQSGRM